MCPIRELHGDFVTTVVMCQRPPAMDYAWRESRLTTMIAVSKIDVAVSGHCLLIVTYVSR